MFVQLTREFLGKKYSLIFSVATTSLPYSML
jgi:hypothetical protein